MGCFSFSVWIMGLYLLERVRFSSGENCICPKIPPRPQTEPPPDTCYQIGSRFRYNCIKNYVRKVGTSNLIICKNDTRIVQWTSASLSCIPHPDFPVPPNTTPTETSTSPESESTTPSSYEGTNITQLNPQETSTQTTNISSTLSSTFDPVTNNSTTSVASSFQENIKAVGIGLTLLIIFCSMIGLGLLLHRRRSRKDTQEVMFKEMEPLNSP